MSVEEATDVVQYEVKGPIATIWINRPEVKNCVNPGLLSGSAKRLPGRSRRRASARWCSVAAATPSAPAPT